MEESRLSAKTANSLNTTTSNIINAQAKQKERAINFEISTSSSSRSAFQKLSQMQEHKKKNIRTLQTPNQVSN